MTMPRRPAGPTPTTPQRVGSRDQLTGVAAALSQEYAGRLDVVSIEGVAADELAVLDEARVREVIAILAIGRATPTLGMGVGETWRRPMTR
jgi:hypothetical protein